MVPGTQALTTKVIIYRYYSFYSLFCSLLFSLYMYYVFYYCLNKTSSNQDVSTSDKRFFLSVEAEEPSEKTTLDFDSYSARILRASTSSVSWTIRAPNEETALAFLSSWESSFVVVVSPKLLKDRRFASLFVSGTMTSSGWFSSRRRTNAGNPLGTRA